MNRGDTAEVAAVFSMAGPATSQWAAEGLESPVEGLFAFGDDFDEARAAFAAVVATAIIRRAITVEGVSPDTLAAVSVHATTRKTFRVTDLLARDQP